MVVLPQPPDYWDHTGVPPRPAFFHLPFFPLNFYPSSCTKFPYSYLTHWGLLMGNLKMEQEIKKEDNLVYKLRTESGNILWNLLKLSSKPILGSVQWYFIWKIKENLTKLKTFLPTRMPHLRIYVWEKPDSLTWELFPWEWWEIPEAQVKFHTRMESLKTWHSGRSRALRKINASKST